jgi:hypothetical protein
MYEALILDLLQYIHFYEAMLNIAFFLNGILVGLNNKN